MQNKIITHHEITDKLYDDQYTGGQYLDLINAAEGTEINEIVEALKHSDKVVTEYYDNLDYDKDVLEDVKGRLIYEGYQIQLTVLKVSRGKKHDVDMLTNMATYLDLKRLIGELKEMLDY